MPPAAWEPPCEAVGFGGEDADDWLELAPGDDELADDDELEDDDGELGNVLGGMEPLELDGLELELLDVAVEALDELLLWLWDCCCCMVLQAASDNSAVTASSSEHRLNISFMAVSIASPLGGSIFSNNS